MKNLLVALLFAFTATASAAPLVAGSVETFKPFVLENCEHRFESATKIENQQIRGLQIARSDIGQCMGECASEQGICISQCQGNGQCIANCNAAHGRCVARCH